MKVINQRPIWRIPRRAGRSEPCPGRAQTSTPTGAPPAPGCAASVNGGAFNVIKLHIKLHSGTTNVESGASNIKPDLRATDQEAYAYARRYR